MEGKEMLMRVTDEGGKKEVVSHGSLMIMCYELSL